MPGPQKQGSGAAVGSVRCGDLEEGLRKTFSALGPIQDFRTVGFRSQHLKTGLSGVAVMPRIGVRSFHALVHPDLPSELFFLAPPSAAAESVARARRVAVLQMSRLDAPH